MVSWSAATITTLQAFGSTATARQAQAQAPPQWRSQVTPVPSKAPLQGSCNSPVLYCSPIPSSPVPPFKLPSRTYYTPPLVYTSSTSSSTPVCCFSSPVAAQLSCFSLGGVNSDELKTNTSVSAWKSNFLALKKTPPPGRKLKYAAYPPSFAHSLPLIITMIAVFVGVEFVV